MDQTLGISEYSQPKVEIRIGGPRVSSRKKTKVVENQAGVQCCLAKISEHKTWVSTSTAALNIRRKGTRLAVKGATGS